MISPKKKFIILSYLVISATHWKSSLVNSLYVSFLLWLMICWMFCINTHKVFFPNKSALVKRLLWICAYNFSIFFFLFSLLMDYILFFSLSTYWLKGKVNCMQNIYSSKVFWKCYLLLWSFCESFNTTLLFVVIHVEKNLFINISLKTHSTRRHNNNQNPLNIPI